MEVDYAKKQLMELLKEGRAGKELALEITGLLSSFFSELDLTVGLYKDGAGIFYSTLPEDEAAYYADVRKMEDLEERPGLVYSQHMELFPVGGYGGYVVLEGAKGHTLDMDRGKQFVWDCGFAMAFCLLAQQSEENYQLDPLTGVLGRSAFRKALKASIDDGNEGYLLATCYDGPHSHAGYWTQQDEENFSLLAKRSQKIFGTAFQISDTMVAMLTDHANREEVFAGMQELSQGINTVGTVYLPLSGLTEENVFNRLNECIMQWSDGKIHGPITMPAKLKLFCTPEEKRKDV